MLVLSRYVDESITFGPESMCTATVRDIQDNVVRLQISDVPPDVVLSTKTKSVVSSGDPMEFVVSRDEDLKVEFREHGGEVQIIFVHSRYHKVRLGVDTPKEWPVHRKEVYDAIRREAEREG